MKKWLVRLNNSTLLLVLKMIHSKQSIDYLARRISVDIHQGIVRWIDATKYHSRLNGRCAGSKRLGTSNGKYYWHVKIDGIPLKRSHIVFLFANGRWPSDQIDHINGNSLDDRIENIREVTHTQNAWNHKGRTKSSGLPMGVRQMPSGKYQARITCNKKVYQIGSFCSLEQAVSAYQTKRKEMFGDYA